MLQRSTLLPPRCHRGTLSARHSLFCTAVLIDRGISHVLIPPGRLTAHSTPAGVNAHIAVALNSQVVWLRTCKILFLFGAIFAPSRVGQVLSWIFQNVDSASTVLSQGSPSLIDSKTDCSRLFQSYFGLSVAVVGVARTVLVIAINFVNANHNGIHKNDRDTAFTRHQLSVYPV